MVDAFASRGNGRAHRVFHPLCGASVETLAVLRARGGIARARAHVFAIACAMATMRLPFTAAEWAGSRLIRRDYPAPVFVVGHWRSGTTHLSNVLSKSGAFGMLTPISVGLPGEALGLARWMGPLIGQFFPRTRLIDGLALGPDLPQEDELAMANLSTLSCNHGVYFPRRMRREFDRGVFGVGVSPAEQGRWARRLERYVAKMTWAAGKPLLIRNPANSARIPLLRAIWPEAQFIHIYRHPAQVYASSVRMFTTLVRELSLGRTQVDVTGLVRHVYPRLMECLLRDGPALSRGFASVRYEDFCRSPMAELARVHAELALPGFASGERTMRAYLDGLGHEAVAHRLDNDDNRWVEERCGRLLSGLGYRDAARAA